MYDNNMHGERIKIWNEVFEGTVQTDAWRN